MSVQQPKFQEQDKFTEDTHKILLAVEEARRKQESCCLKIEFSDNGGVMTIILESKKRYK